MKFQFGVALLVMYSSAKTEGLDIRGTWGSMKNTPNSHRVGDPQKFQIVAPLPGGGPSDMMHPVGLRMKATSISSKISIPTPVASQKRIEIRNSGPGNPTNLPELTKETTTIPTDKIEEVKATVETPDKTKENIPEEVEKIEKEASELKEVAIPLEKTEDMKEVFDSLKETVVEGLLEKIEDAKATDDEKFSALVEKVEEMKEAMGHTTPRQQLELIKESIQGQIEDIKEKMEDIKPPVIDFPRPELEKLKTNMFTNLLDKAEESRTVPKDLIDMLKDSLNIEKLPSLVEKLDGLKEAVAEKVEDLKKETTENPTDIKVGTDKIEEIKSDLVDKMEEPLEKFKEIKEEVTDTQQPNKTTEGIDKVLNKEDNPKEDTEGESGIKPDIIQNPFDDFKDLILNAFKASKMVGDRKEYFKHAISSMDKEELHDLHDVLVHAFNSKGFVVPTTGEKDATKDLKLAVHELADREMDKETKKTLTEIEHSLEPNATVTKDKNNVGIDLSKRVGMTSEQSKGNRWWRYGGPPPHHWHHHGRSRSGHQDWGHERGGPGGMDWGGRRGGPGGMNWGGPGGLNWGGPGGMNWGGPGGMNWGGPGGMNWGGPGGMNWGGPGGMNWGGKKGGPGGMNWGDRKGGPGGMDWGDRKGGPGGMEWGDKKGGPGGMDWGDKKGGPGGMDWGDRTGGPAGMDWGGKRGGPGGMDWAGGRGGGFGGSWNGSRDWNSRRDRGGGRDWCKGGGCARQKRSYSYVTGISITTGTNSASNALSKLTPPARLRQPLRIPYSQLNNGGPQEMYPRASAAIQLPILNMADPLFDSLLDDIKDGLRYVLQTKNEWTLALHGTGHTGCHAVLDNLIESGDKALVLITGYWSNLMANMSERLGAQVVRYNKSPGTTFNLAEIETAIKVHRPDLVLVVHGESDTSVTQPLDGIGDLCAEYDCLLVVDAVASAAIQPVLVDKNKIDAVFSNSHKGFGSISGTSPVSLSPRAVRKVKDRLTPPRAFQTDLAIQYALWNTSNPSRPRLQSVSLSLLYGLRESLATIAEERLENTFKRHEQARGHLGRGLTALGLRFFVERPEDRQVGFTAVWPPAGKDPYKIVNYVYRNYNIAISPGFGPTLGKVLRIATFGYNADIGKMNNILRALKNALASWETNI